MRPNSISVLLWGMAVVGGLVACESEGSGGGSGDDDDDDDDAWFTCFETNGGCYCSDTSPWGPVVDECSVDDVSDGPGLCCSTGAWPSSGTCLCVPFACACGQNGGNCLFGLVDGTEDYTETSCAAPDGVCCARTDLSLGGGASVCDCEVRFTECSEGWTEVPACTADLFECADFTSLGGARYAEVTSCWDGSSGGGDGDADADGDACPEQEYKLCDPAVPDEEECPCTGWCSALFEDYPDDAYCTWYCVEDSDCAGRTAQGICRNARCR